MAEITEIRCRVCGARWYSDPDDLTENDECPNGCVDDAPDIVSLDEFGSAPDRCDACGGSGDSTGVGTCDECGGSGIVGEDVPEDPDVARDRDIAAAGGAL